MSSSRKIGRNEPCPCASGRKYKHCCWQKQFDWVRTEDGKVARRIPLHPEVQRVLAERRQDYIARHGHEPGPDAPLIPGIAGISTEDLTNQMAEVMDRAGFDAAFIYAFRKTGLIVTQMNEALLPDRDLQEWADAVDEYRRDHKAVASH